MQDWGWQLPGSALPMLSSQMLRTQWVLNWPGQVTIAGCQTYWTMEVAEALEANNLSNRLFPQLTQQVGVKGGTICSPIYFHPRRAQSPQELFPVLILGDIWGWIQRAESQTPLK